MGFSLRRSPKEEEKKVTEGSPEDGPTGTEAFDKIPPSAPVLREVRLSAGDKFQSWLEKKRLERAKKLEEKIAKKLENKEKKRKEKEAEAKLSTKETKDQKAARKSKERKDKDREKRERWAERKGLTLNDKGEVIAASIDETLAALKLREEERRKVPVDPLKEKDADGAETKDEAGNVTKAAQLVPPQYFDIEFPMGGATSLVAFKRSVAQLANPNANWDQNNNQGIYLVIKNEGSAPLSLANGNVVYVSGVVDKTDNVEKPAQLVAILQDDMVVAPGTIKNLFVVRDPEGERAYLVSGLGDVAMDRMMQVSVAPGGVAQASEAVTEGLTPTPAAAVREAPEVLTKPAKHNRHLVIKAQLIPLGKTDAPSITQDPENALDVQGKLGFYVTIDNKLTKDIQIKAGEILWVQGLTKKVGAVEAPTQIVAEVTQDMTIPPGTKKLMLFVKNDPMGIVGPVTNLSGVKIENINTFPVQETPKA